MGINQVLCTKCNEIKGIENFFKRKNGKNRTPCKECIASRRRVYDQSHHENNKVTYKKYRERNIEKVREQNRIRASKKYYVLKAYVDRIKLDSGCVDCGYKEHACALDFDHVWGIKRIEIAKILTYLPSFSTLEEELEKCVVRCACCHRIRTEKERICKRNFTPSVLRKKSMVIEAKINPALFAIVYSQLLQWTWII